MFGMFGTLFMMVDLWFPITLIPMVSMGLKTMGAMLLWIGVGLYIMRSYSTGAYVFIDLPNSHQTICVHQGKSSTKLIKGRKTEPNRIQAKGKGYRGTSTNMNIKDTGLPLNVAGHDVVITSQDIGHNIPLWVADAVDKWKQKYGVRNEDEFLNLYHQIKNIKTHSDLYDIEFLQPLLKDSDKKFKLYNMKIDDLREMKECLFDGRVVNVKNYLDWSESATPYDNESIIDSDVSHRLSQMSNFLKGQSGDMMKYVIVMGILLMFGVIAYKMIGG
jgi:hypothetical protein